MTDYPVMTSRYSAPDEPKWTCPDCGKRESIRWFQQSVRVYIEWVQDGKSMGWYGLPLTGAKCLNCHKGHRRGRMNARPGYLWTYSTDPTDVPPADKRYDPRVHTSVLF